MCEFCHKHGEGKKWYLQAKNYSEDLLSDVKRRKFIESFSCAADSVGTFVEKLDDFDKTPAFLKRLLRWHIPRRMKKEHFGQVVPIEDVEKVFDFVNSIVRIACICRHATLGKEKRYCYGVSMGPRGGKLAQIFGSLDQSFYSGPDTDGMEELSRDEAVKLFKEHEEEGLCHTVWTFYSPFIGGICNCDRADCLAMRTTISLDIPTMFRAEYVAELNPDLCVGCRQCMRVCQFGAISYSAGSEKAVIDQKSCYGCGVCRSACGKDAIRLRERAEVPAVANLW